jgi:hypothetical protein
MELVFRDTCCCPSAKEAGCDQQLFNWAHKIVEREKTRDPWPGIIYEQAPAHKWKKQGTIIAALRLKNWIYLLVFP